MGLHSISCSERGKADDDGGEWLTDVEVKGGNGSREAPRLWKILG